MSLVVIHQPYFLPWLGYFSKLHFADKFVILDDVHFTKGFYLDRTKYIDTNGEVRWLSLPTGQNYQVALKDVTLRDKEYSRPLLRTIESCYAKAEYYRNEWPDLKRSLKTAMDESSTLVDLNIALLHKVAEVAGLDLPEIVRSSEIACGNERTERIVTICKDTGCDGVLIGGGNSIPVHDWNRITTEGITIWVQDYFSMHPSYKQVRRQRIGFAKGVSIIDALLNVGRAATKEMLVSELVRPKIAEIWNT